jgi:diguanylate cyclase
MRLSMERVAGVGLAIAAATIVALAAVLLNDVAREIDLSRDLIATQQVRESLEGLRSATWRLRFASRGLAGTATEARVLEIKRELAGIEAELEYLRAKSGEDIPAADRLPLVEPPLRDLVSQARMIEHLLLTQGAAAAAAFAASPDAFEREEAALTAAARALEAVTRDINDASLEQIRLSEGSRTSVTWLLGGSILVLAGLFMVFRHLQARNREYQNRIERLAHFDPLTGLPNRILLTDRLQHAVTIAVRGNAPLALLMFDLDGFKNVNDTLGHAAGDALLKDVGQRARECVRASDTVGRLGGDEFLAVLPETDAHGAEHVGRKLLEAMAHAHVIDGHDVSVSVSVGASLLPQHGQDIETLLRAADAALYEAKSAGKNCYRLR